MADVGVKFQIPTEGEACHWSQTPFESICE